MIKNKTICFFSGGVSRSGGTERVLSILANEFVNIYKNVIIINFIGENNESFYKLDKRIKIINLYQKRVNTLLYYPLTIIKLISIFKKNKIDIFIDVEVLLTFYSKLAISFFKIKHISWEHFNYYHDLGIKRRKWSRIIAGRYCDYIITLTNEDKNYYLNNLKIKNNIEYIYNPNPFEKIKNINFNKNTKIVIAIGRLNYQKNFSELLKIWYEIESKNSDWLLKIIGSGEEKEKLEKEKNKLGLKKIEFIENTNKIEKYYKEAELYLMTSIFEGLPMTLIEAQGFGIPIVSYDCKTGPKDIVKNNETGFLIQNQNRKEFINKVNLLMNNKKLRIKFSERSKINSFNFKLNTIIKKWENILEKISN